MWEVLWEIIDNSKDPSNEDFWGLFCLKKWAQITESIFLDEAIMLQLLLVLFVSMFLQTPATVHFFFNPFQFIFLFAMIFIIPPCLISAVSIFDGFFQEVVDFS